MRCALGSIWHDIPLPGRWVRLMALPAYHARSTTLRRVLGYFSPKTQVVSSHSWGSGKQIDSGVSNRWQEEIDKLLGCTSSFLCWWPSGFMAQTMLSEYQNASSRTEWPVPLVSLLILLCLRHPETQQLLDSGDCSQYISVHLSTSCSQVRGSPWWSSWDSEAMPRIQLFQMFTKCGRKMCKLRSGEIHRDVLRIPYIHLQDSTS